MQASSVASEGVFSAARFQLGEHRHSLAADNLEISVLFRDWINAERRNLGREPLPTKFQDDVDEVTQDYSDDGIEAMEDLSIQPIPEHVTKEMLNDLRRDLYVAPTISKSMIIRDLIQTEPFLEGGCVN